MDLEEEIKKVNEEIFNIRFRMEIIKRDYPDETKMQEDLKKELKETKRKMSKLLLEKKQGGNIR